MQKVENSLIEFDSLNEVIMEEKDQPMNRILERNGFEVISRHLDVVYKLDGIFHCYKVDIRRKGKLELNYTLSVD